MSTDHIWLNAKLAGEKTYLGKSCTKCGNRTRYTSSKVCIDCSKRNYLANKHVYNRKRSAKGRAELQAMSALAGWPVPEHKRWQGPTGKPLSRVRVKGAID